jgi:hypothetical protein
MEDGVPMDREFIAKYDEDAGERLMRLLEDIHFRDNLAGAADLVGQQLELLKPSMLGFASDGTFRAGPVAKVHDGTILILIGNDSRLVTTHILASPDHRAYLEYIADGMRERVPDALDGQNPRDVVVSACNRLIQKYGGRPGKKTKQVPSPEIDNTIGIMLAALDEKRAQVLDAVDVMTSNGVCPALVALVGPATSGVKGQFCFAWPLILPLAPYQGEMFAERT